MVRVRARALLGVRACALPPRLPYYGDMNELDDISSWPGWSFRLQLTSRSALGCAFAGAVGRAAMRQHGSTLCGEVPVF